MTGSQPSSVHFWPPLYVCTVYAGQLLGCLGSDKINVLSHDYRGRLEGASDRVNISGSPSGSSVAPYPVNMKLHPGGSNAHITCSPVGFLIGWGIPGP